jgi:hypothetical protein
MPQVGNCPMVRKARIRPIKEIILNAVNRALNRIGWNISETSGVDCHILPELVRPNAAKRPVPSHFG